MNQRAKNSTNIIREYYGEEKTRVIVSDIIRTSADDWEIEAQLYNFARNVIWHQSPRHVKSDNCPVCIFERSECSCTPGNFAVCDVCKFQFADAEIPY